MAHSDTFRNGRKNVVFKPGHKIGLIVNGKLHQTTVNHVDGGEWIYPAHVSGVATPGWCRSQQVIDLEV